MIALFLISLLVNLVEFYVLKHSDIYYGFDGGFTWKMMGLLLIVVPFLMYTVAIVLSINYDAWNLLEMQFIFWFKLVNVLQYIVCSNILLAFNHS